ncbi:hypothetical protein PUN28_011482 [Cardiocondyla obscurior]|uniref:Uncharacterized protein n=1 Tax=Cardiocondyla obscurior TaxID=286306 RepID=A0AAW2FE03_9HYME
MIRTSISSVNILQDSNLIRVKSKTSIINFSQVYFGTARDLWSTTISGCYCTRVKNSLT